LAASIISILLLLLFPQKSRFIATLLLLEVVSCCFDQNRWQPWEYQFCFLLLIQLLNKNNWMPIYLFILCCTYTYSGLHKFDPRFLTGVWQQMMLRKFFQLSNETVQQPWLYYSGYLLALLETILGILFFTKKFRVHAGVGLILMHLYILWVIGPLGNHYNPIVWPWNVLMILTLALIILNQPSPIYELIFKIKNLPVILCWAILPALCFWGLWDNYLSVNLYSGKTPYGYYCIAQPEKAKALTPYFIKADASIKCTPSGSAVVSLQQWALKEMKSPFYPELRIITQSNKWVQQLIPEAGATLLLRYWEEQ
jgi:hypothetical protein